MSTEPADQSPWMKRVRLLIYPVQFETDPAAGVERVMSMVVHLPTASATPAEFLAAAREAQASSVDLSTLLPIQLTDAAIRGYLAVLEQRLVADLATGKPSPGTARGTTDQSRPIIPLPDALTGLVLDAGSAVKQRWRGTLRGRPVIVRLARFEAGHWPVVNPVEVFEHAVSVAAKAALANTAMPLGGGGDTAGVYVIEALAPGAPLASLAEATWHQVRAWLLPIAEDLLRLRQARQWHGGVRPSRICLCERGATLVGYAWATWVSMLVPELFARLAGPMERGRGFWSPELLRDGPRGAGPDTDLYGLGQTIAFALTGQANGALPAGVPTAARRVIDAARAPELADRCRWSDLVAALRD